MKTHSINTTGLTVVTPSSQKTEENRVADRWSANREMKQKKQTALERNAHVGNFFAGPHCLFHPGLFR